MADLQVIAPCKAVQAENHTSTLPLGQTPQDQAREIPFGGPFTDRERANVLAINDVWDVAHNLETAQEHFEEVAQLVAEGRYDAETRYWVAYYIRRLPSICQDNRDRLMKAAQIMAEANGVRFMESTGRGALAGKDCYMCVQASFACGIAQSEQEVSHA